MVRGKILRDTNAGDGVVFVNGEQKTFTLESHWRSDEPPRVGAVVDVTLDAEGQVALLSRVDEAQIIKEQTEKALGVAKERGSKAFGLLLSQVGAPTLVAIVLLAVAWLFMSAINVQIAADFKASVTFYDILKVVNSGRGLEAFQAAQSAGAGIYGFLMFAALLVPLVPHFHSNKFLNLAYCAPLVYILVIVFGVYFNIRSQISQARGLASGFGGAQGAAFAEQMLSEMMSMALKAVSFGIGFYVAVAVALYLASIGVKKFLVSNIQA